MYIGFSKTIAKFGGFRLGVGMRMNKKNAAWMWLVILGVSLLKLMWYMMIVVGWLIYAMCYGTYWCVKKIVRACSKKKKARQQNIHSTMEQDSQFEEDQDTYN